MAKKTDNHIKQPAAPVKSAAPTAPVASATPGKIATPPKPAPPMKRAAKPTAKAKPAGKSARPPAAKSKKTAGMTARTKSAYTRDDVALRAYFISEKRRAHGHHGDEHQDWLDAERQLAAESGGLQKAKKA